MIKKILVEYKFTSYSVRRDLIPFVLLRYYKFKESPTLTIQIYYGWWKWSGTLDISIGDLPIGIN